MVARKQIQFWYEHDRASFNKYFEDVCFLSSFIKVVQEDGTVTPCKLTPSQKELFFSIVTRWQPRVLALTITRWGKSWTIAKGVVTAMTSQPNSKWTIVAPTADKAKIIFDYIKQDLFNTPQYFAMIPKKFVDVREKMMHERSQNRITLVNGSEVRILSADVDNKQQAGIKLMGFGASNLIIDESAELNDETYGKAFRMLGDHPETSFVCELGNPWTRGHFFESFEDKNYHKIIVDWKKALAEGRTTVEFIDEMRRKAHFDVLYECKFPREDRVSKEGWMVLFTESLLNVAIINDEFDIPMGDKILGVDCSYSGSDENVWCLRDGTTIRILSRDNNKNPLDIIGKTMMLAEQEGVREENIWLDVTAGGNIIWKAFDEAGYDINGVNFAESAYDKEHYENRRAEIYHEFYNWLSNGGKIVQNQLSENSTKGDLGDWKEILDMKCKRTSKGKLQMIDKETLRKTTGKSPDIADSAAITCAGGIENLSMTRQKREDRISVIRKKRTKYR